MLLCKFDILRFKAVVVIGNLWCNGKWIIYCCGSVTWGKNVTKKCD